MSHTEHYWWELVEEDLAVAESLLAAEHYRYVGFMCHLVIEKALKAVIARRSLPPKIHNLTRLSEIAELNDQMDQEQLQVLDLLEPMNIEGRYPAAIASLTSGMNSARATTMLASTKELCKWIKAR